MRDRFQQKLGVYTKRHGFMTMEGFQTWKGPEKEKPQQVTAVEYRRIQRDKERSADAAQTLST